jgi:hypothetical protein
MTDLDNLITAVASKLIDRDVALHRVTFPAAVVAVKELTDEQLTKAVAIVATTDKQRGLVAAAKIEQAYRSAVNA